MPFGWLMFAVGLIDATLQTTDPWSFDMTQKAFRTINALHRKRGMAPFTPTAQIVSSTDYSSPSSTIVDVHSDQHGCNTTDRTLNHCQSYLQNELHRSCHLNRHRQKKGLVAKPSTPSPCGLRFGAGYFIIQPPWDEKTTQRHHQDNKGHGLFTGFQLQGVDNVVFEGAPPTHNNSINTIIALGNLTQVFRIVDCSGLTIQGIGIFQLRVPYTYGLAVSEESILFDSTMYPIDVANYPWLAQGVLFDGYQEPKKNGDDAAYCGYYLGDPYINLVHTTRAQLTYSTATAHQSKMMLMKIQGLPAGQALRNNTMTVVRHWKFQYVTLSFINVTNIALDNIAILSGGGQALALGNCGQINITNSMIVPNGGYPMSVNAGGLIFDGFNTKLSEITTTVGLSVENTFVVSTGDDTFNLNTHFVKIQNISNDGKTVTIMDDEFDAQHLDEFTSGDEMAFMNGQTLQTIENYSAVASFATPRIGGRVMRFDTEPLDTTRVHAGDMLYAKKDIPHKVVIRNNVFGYNVGRALLIRGVDVLIERNQLHKTLGPAVLVELDACLDYNGILVQNFMFRENFVVDPLLGPAKNLAQFGTLAITARQHTDEKGRHPHCFSTADSVKNNHTLPSQILFHNVSIMDNAFIYQSLFDPRSTDEIPSTIATVRVALTQGVHLQRNHVDRRGPHPPPAPSNSGEFDLITSVGVICANNTCLGKSGSCECNV